MLNWTICSIPITAVVCFLLLNCPSLFFFFNKHLKLISELCEFSVCYSRDDHGNTPLHNSARYDNLQAVEVFLKWQYRNQGEEQAELVCNNEGKTSAHLAAEFDNPR